jgi:hypothetical protein
MDGLRSRHPEAGLLASALTQLTVLHCPWLWVVHAHPHVFVALMHAANNDALSLSSGPVALSQTLHCDALRRHPQAQALNRLLRGWGACRMPAIDQPFGCTTAAAACGGVLQPDLQFSALQQGNQHCCSEPAALGPPRMHWCEVESRLPLVEEI